MGAWFVGFDQAFAVRCLHSGHHQLPCIKPSLHLPCFNGQKGAARCGACLKFSWWPPCRSLANVGVASAFLQGGGPPFLKRFQQTGFLGPQASRNPGGLCLGTMRPSRCRLETPPEYERAKNHCQHNNVRASSLDGYGLFVERCSNRYVEMLLQGPLSCDLSEEAPSASALLLLETSCFNHLDIKQLLKARACLLLSSLNILDCNYLPTSRFSFRQLWEWGSYVRSAIPPHSISHS